MYKQLPPAAESPSEDRPPHGLPELPQPRGWMQSTFRKCNGGGEITTKEGSSRNHVLNRGQANAGGKGMDLALRDPSRALPGGHMKGFGYFPTTESELHSGKITALGKLQVSQQRPRQAHVTLRFRVCLPFFFS